MRNDDITHDEYRELTQRPRRMRLFWCKEKKKSHIRYYILTDNSLTALAIMNSYYPRMIFTTPLTVFPPRTEMDLRDFNILCALMDGALLPGRLDVFHVM